LDVWKLLGFISGAANWVKLSAGSSPGGTVVSLSDTVGGGTKVFPDGTGNISLTGTAGQITVTSNPGTNNLNLSLAGGGTAIDQIAVQVATGPGVTPVNADATGLITVNGATVAAHATPLETHSRALNAYNIEVQRASTSAATNATQQGLASFNSAQFTADASGWVTLAGGSGPPVLGLTPQAFTGPGTSPVIPNGTGLIAVSGSAVAAATIPVRSDSLAANTVTIEVQRASTSAATNATQQGLASFSSAQFTADASGWVTLAGGSGPPVLGINVDANTGPGTDPVIPTSGIITVTGAQVAPATVGANVIRTDSLAANTYTIEVQQADTAAASDTTKNGVAHFNSANFSDNNSGFISLAGGATVSSFLAFLNASVANVTGDGTAYPIVLNSTSYNVGSNFSTGTGKYTAPVNGKYFFSATVPILNIGAAHDKGRWSIIIENAAAVTQQSYEYCQVSPAAVRNADTNACFAGSVIVTMAATDRAYIMIQVDSSTKTVGVGGSAAVTSSPYATLSGYLLP